ncbi:MAG: hypothetical protein JSV86_19880 [Gemmatimonadota bacterium]|nr:MAG: hypothetical protein JSV86_19880 [Gemmatimonadota bacterium]
MGTPLTVSRATDLAKALSGRRSTYSRYGMVLVSVEDGRLVFRLVELVRNPAMGGGADWPGAVLTEHSLALNVTDEARAVAHYEGFCEAYGLGVDVGDAVDFPSGSAPSGSRTGKVIAVTPRRVQIRAKWLSYDDYFETWVAKGDAWPLGRRIEVRRPEL